MIDFIIENLFQAYYIIIVFAIVLSFIAINFILSLSKLERLYLLSSYTFTIFGMIIFSKVLFIPPNKIYYDSLFSMIFSGFSYVGGIIGYILFIKLYNIIYKGVPKVINSLLLLAIPLIYSLSKIACYISNCCIGTLTFPIQLLEFLLYLAIFFIFTFLYKKYNYIFAYLSILVLCIVRFIIDFYRVNRAIVIFNFSLSQILCMCIFLFELIEILIYQNQLKNNSLTIIEK